MTESLNIFETPKLPLNILLLADKGFMRRCKNVSDYLERLHAYFVKQKGPDVRFHTPSNSHNIELRGVNFVMLDSRNKTAFIHSLENTIQMYDECYIISIPGSVDMFLEGARETFTDNNKPITQLGYELKS